jgi:hypothetical protein
MFLIGGKRVSSEDAKARRKGRRRFSVSSLSQVPQFEAQSTNFSDRKGPQTLILAGGRVGQYGRRIQAGSLFLGLRWLDTALDLPSTRLTRSKAPLSRSTPRHPHFNQTSWVTANLGDPQPFAPFASSREIADPITAVGWPTNRERDLCCDSPPARKMGWLPISVIRQLRDKDYLLQIFV